MYSAVIVSSVTLATKVLDNLVACLTSLTTSPLNKDTRGIGSSRGPVLKVAAFTALRLFGASWCGGNTSRGP